MRGDVARVGVVGESGTGGNARSKELEQIVLGAGELHASMLAAEDQGVSGWAESPPALGSTTSQMALTHRARSRIEVVASLSGPARSSNTISNTLRSASSGKSPV